MRWPRWLLLLVLPLLITDPNTVFGVGNVVGRNCNASWGAVTTHTDGSPITGAITYNLYIKSVATPVPQPGITPPDVTGITATASNVCQSLSPGQWYIWVTAVEQLPSSSSESAVSATVPFLLVVPSAPAGVSVQ